MTRPTLGDRIKRRRRELGLSQAELAKRIDVDEQTVLRYEKNRIDIPKSRLARIAEELDTTVGTLMDSLDGESTSGHSDAGGVIREDARVYEWTSPRVKLLPIRARQLLLEYESRMKKAGLPDEAIDSYERSIIDLTWGQYHARVEPPRTEEQWVKLVKANWEIVAELIRQGGRSI